MIAVTAAMRVRVAVEPVDFRRGIDGLARGCREVLSVDPFSGALFLFRNRRGTALKILAYDGQGFGFAKNGFRAGIFRTGPARGAKCSASCSRTS
jgi:transposase